LYFLLILRFSQIHPELGHKSRHSGTITPAWSQIFGANIDIFLKSRKNFRLFFRKNMKKLPFLGRFSVFFMKTMQKSLYTSLLHLIIYILELGRLWSSREGYDITDVLHAGDEKDEALEAESEACMRAGTPAASVEIPPELVGLHLSTVDLSHELVVRLLTDRAANDFSNLGEEDVGALHGWTGGHGATVAYGGG